MELLWVYRTETLFKMMDDLAEASRAFVTPNTDKFKQMLDEVHSELYRRNQVGKVRE